MEEQPATYRGNLRLSYGENHHLEIVQKLPDVLGAIEWVIGLDSERPFVVDSAAGPPRVSVYIGLDRPIGHRDPPPRSSINVPANKSRWTSRNWGGSPPGGGLARPWGRGNVADSRATQVGYAFIHTAIDSHTRLAYSEVLGDEKAVTAIGFAGRAPRLVRRPRHHRRGRPDRQRFLLQGLRRSPPRSKPPAPATTGSHPDVPQWNGKVERFNRTLLDEWAYVRVYRSETARTTP